MGFFGTFVFIDGTWRDRDEGPDGGTWLRVDIHDSDIAQVDYRPALTGRGQFYLGWEPAVYFEDPSASEPVDAPAEAEAFNAWVELVGGTSVPLERLLPLLADAGGEEPEEVFVEEAVVKLLRLVNLPLPEALRSSG